MLLRFLPEDLVLNTDTAMASQMADMQMQLAMQQESVVKEERSSDSVEGYSYIDTEKGIVNCGADKEAYMEVLKIYYESGENRISDFQRYLDIQDYKNYVIAVHGLKSSSASIGAYEFSELAKAHEFAGKESRYDFIHNGIDKLISEYRKVLNEAYKILLNAGLVEEEQAEVEVSGDVERALVEGFKDMMIQLDLAGIRRVYEYSKGLSLSEDTRKFIEDLINALDEGNIKVANQLVNHSRT